MLIAMIWRSLRFTGSFTRFTALYIANASMTITKIANPMIMIAVLINQMTIGLQSAIQATGKIKKYMLTVGFVKLFIIPIGYFLLKNNYSLFYVMVAYVFLEFLAGVLRIINMNYYGLSFIVFLKNVLLNLILSSILVLLIDDMVVEVDSF